MGKKIYSLVVISLSFFLLSNCASFMKRAAIDSTGLIIEDAMKAFFEEDDLTLAEQAVPSNLKLIEGLLKGSPENDRLLLMATRFYASYAFGFLEEKYPQNPEEGKIKNARAKAFYKKATNFGFRSLNKNERFKNTINSNCEEFEKALKEFDKSKVPILFWTAYAWGNYINLQQSEAVNLGKVELMMRRVLELDETYYNGGVHLFYMVYYAGRPKILGGDLNKAQDHYNKAKEITKGKFLMADYMYALYYGITSANRNLFETTLKNIINAPSDIYPEERLTNEIAKKKAFILLSQIENFAWIDEDENDLTN